MWLRAVREIRTPWEWAERRTQLLSCSVFPMLLAGTTGRFLSLRGRQVKQLAASSGVFVCAKLFRVSGIASGRLFCVTNGTTSGQASENVSGFRKQKKAISELESLVLPRRYGRSDSRTRLGGTPGMGLERS